ncbi:hypothetical protein PRIC1_000737 [Phytophthora ramorum]
MTPLEDSIECLRVEMISEMQCELFEDYICICFHEKGESKKFEKTASLLMGRFLRSLADHANDQGGDYFMGSNLMSDEMQLFDLI